MTYKAFYYFYSNEKEQDHDHPIPIEQNRIKKELLDSLKHEGDFFGLVDELDQTLQAIYDADENTYWVEIPVPEKQGSYGIVMLYKELEELLAGLPDLFTPDKFPGFEFEEWDPVE